MYTRILTLKYSDSFGITSSMIILEQETLASPSLFKHKQVNEAFFRSRSWILERCARFSPDPSHVLLSLGSLW